VVVEQFDRGAIRAKQLSKEITTEKIAALIDKQMHSFLVDVNCEAAKASVPLITPTEQLHSPVAACHSFVRTDQDPFQSPRQPTRIMHSPLA